MIEFGEFRSSSGLLLPYKINCDDFTDKDWYGCAQMILRNIAFSCVIGVPTGGKKLQDALIPFIGPSGPVLIVDDVFTTGRSMEEYRLKYPEPVIGAVVFAHNSCPYWIHPLFAACEWAR
jgi:orotate phosphoribosyltransferase